MSGTVIRLARAGDAGALHAAVAALAEHLGDGERFRATPDDLLRHGFGERPLFRALLAEEAGEVLGAAVYFPEFSTLRGCPGVYIQDLWIVPARRGSGLGRRLLAAVAEDAAAWGSRYMKLATHATNPDAVAFYRRLGFWSDEGEVSLRLTDDAYAALRETP